MAVSAAHMAALQKYHAPDSRTIYQSKCFQRMNLSGDYGMFIHSLPGATEADLKEIEREIDGGRIEYEGSIWYGGYEYEFEIDGSTGNILQWEIDD